MKEHFLLLLLLAALVAVIDFSHVVSLLLEQATSLHNSIVQINVATVFLRLQVQVIEELDETLVELSDLNL